MISRFSPLLFVVVTPLVTHAEDDHGKRSLTIGDRVVMTYNAAHMEAPNGDAWFGRSGFIHPVYTPSGRVVTEAFPADHMHQHALMFAWTNAEFDGRDIDFWNARKQQGRVRHLKTTHADATSIAAQLRHLDDSGENSVPVLDETWEMHGVHHDLMNVFDLVSTQTCASDQPLTIKQYHYGAMCIRGPSAWLDGATMLTSDGKGRPEGNHTRPNWVALYGKIDGQTCGIVAMGHPGNFRAPQPVRLHPKKPYFCFAPMVLGEFQIKPGEPYVSRFRFAAFDGEPDVNALNQLWKDFAEQ